jgi:hypothetical protein
LPPGTHVTEVVEVERRLVQMFESSITRKDIYRGWRDRRQALFDLVPLEYEWLDGSFVTAKQNPRDLDVVTFIEGTAIDSLSKADRDRLLEHFLRPRTKLRFGCDAYLVAIRPPAHPSFNLYERQRRYWDTWWGHERDGTEKGYLEARGVP